MAVYARLALTLVKDPVCCYWLALAHIVTGIKHAMVSRDATIAALEIRIAGLEAFAQSAPSGQSVVTFNGSTVTIP